MNWTWFHQWGSPKWFYERSGRWLPWLAAAAVLLLAVGIVWGLAFAPPEKYQGNSYRIIYIHVPAAFLAQSCYLMMAIAGAVGLIWKMKLADVALQCAAPIGAWMTAVALVTGAIWGKPTWGSWWVWDARLTSMLILLFLYFGFIALTRAIEVPRRADRAGAIIALVGAVNVPIIYFSVQWWNTLHQGASVSLTKAPSMATTMLTGMLVMALASWAYTLAVVLWRVRPMILERERHTEWVGAELERAGKLSQTAGGRA